MRKRTDRAERHQQRVELTLALYSRDPQEVYANLLWLWEQRGGKRKWIGCCFKDLFGEWPRLRVTPEPVRPTDCVLEHWLALRKRPPSRFVQSGNAIDQWIIAMMPHDRSGASPKTDEAPTGKVEASPEL